MCRKSFLTETAEQLSGVELHREEDDLNFIEVFGCEKAVNACDWICLKLQKSF